jgi:hypothetical protein
MATAHLAQSSLSLSCAVPVVVLVSISIIVIGTLTEANLAA